MVSNLCAVKPQKNTPPTYILLANLFYFPQLSRTSPAHNIKAKEISHNKSNRTTFIMSIKLIDVYVFLGICVLITKSILSYLHLNYIVSLHVVS